MGYVESCLACQTNRGTVKPPGGPIVQGAFWSMEHTLLPTVPGWLIVKSLRHVTSLTQLPRNATIELGDMLYLAETAILEIVAPERLYVGRFCEVVEHLHFHVFPRSAAMAIPGANGPQLFAIAAGRTEWHGAPEEIDRVAAAIRNRIAELSA